MTNEEIKLCFGISPKGAVSLREQLEKRIADYLDTSSEGAVIPSERLLSEVLGVSRVTVRNALEPHFRTGRIIRQRRRGTVVAKGGVTHLPVNELALGLPWTMTPPVHTLRFLSYENLPNQQQFWNAVTESFHQKHPQYRIEIVLVNSVPSAHAFKEYLLREDTDIFIHSHIFGAPSPEEAIALPQELLSALRSDENLDIGLEEIKTEDFRLFPFHLEWCNTYWNGKLAKECGLKDVRRRLLKGDKIPMILEALDRLPANCHGGSHIWCQLAHHGLPSKIDEPEAMLSQLQALLPLRGKSNAYFTSQTAPLDDVEAFVAGKVLFLDAYATQLQSVGKPSWAMGQLPCPLRCGRRFAHSQDLAIAPHCCNLEGAVLFLKYLLSSEVQQMLWKIKEVVPIRREEYLLAMKTRYGFDTKTSVEFAKNLHVFKEAHGVIETAMEFLLHDVRDELAGLLAGSSTPERIAQRIMRKWQCKKNSLPH